MRQIIFVVLIFIVTAIVFFNRTKCDGDTFLVRYKSDHDPMAKVQEEKLAAFLSSLDVHDIQEINKCVIAQAEGYVILPKKGPYRVEISCKHNKDYFFTYEECDSMGKNVEIWPCDKKYFDQIQKMYQRFMSENKF